jgi:hypothetical protein
MSDRADFVVGLILGLFGVILLARLDVPYIQRGGLAGGLAALELLIAVLVLSAAAGASRYR